MISTFIKKKLSLCYIVTNFFCNFEKKNNSLKKNKMEKTLTTSTILSKDNTALLLVDHQIGLLSGVRDFSTA